MIVVTGSVAARDDSFAEVRKLSLEHAHRSRTAGLVRGQPPLVAATATLQLYDAVKLERL